MIYCDNIGSTYLCAKPVFHSRVKSLEVDFHFVHDVVKKGLLRVAHASTKDQPADILTKPFSHLEFDRLRDKIGICTHPADCPS